MAGRGLVMFTSIVVGVDGSRPSLAAAHAAMILAARDHGQLHLVSVIEETPRYVAVREEASREEEAAREYYRTYHNQLIREAEHQGVASTTSAFLIGHEVQQLFTYLDEVHADLLVIGHAGHSGVWGSALGSTASQLVRRAPCSVLVVRAQGQGTAIHFARIAVALDGSPLGWEAYEVALDLARESHHPLQVISALENSPLEIGAPSSSSTQPIPVVTASSSTGSLSHSTGSLAQGTGSTRQFLVHAQARAAIRAAAVDTPVEVSMHSGPASDALVRAARGLAVDVLVAGATGHEHPWSMTTGATAMKVAEEAPCAVLLVRLRANSNHVTVHDVMQSAETAAPDTPVANVLALLLEHQTRLMPVVQADGTLAGVVTLGSLLRRIDPQFTAHLSSLRTPTEARAHLERLTAGRTVCETMITHPFVLRPDVPLDVAGRYLTAHHVTRAPVVDAAHHYAGIVSDRDIVGALLASHELQLSAVAPPIMTEPMVSEAVASANGQAVEALADRSTPSLPEMAGADEVVRAVHESVRGLVMVVNGDGRLVGIIDGSALLGLALPAESASWVARLARTLPRLTQSWLGRGHGRAEEPLTAAGLMRPPDLVFEADCPLSDALVRLLQNASTDAGIVVASDGRPVGPLWRAVAVRALVRG
jgi:nucleotide-binding universal stress UspA family protein/CBS domain-containing protein